MQYRNALFLVVLLVLLLQPFAAGAQDAKPEAMTADDIVKQLDKEPPVRGEVLHDGKVLCSLEETSGVPVALSETTGPTYWLHLKKSPELSLRLESEADIERVHLLRNGQDDPGIKLILTPKPGDATLYALGFSKELPNGDYEFAVSRGSLFLFPRCGFTLRGDS